MRPIIPYLNFKGNAQEALDLYVKVFDGKILHSQTYAESGQDANPAMKDKIMHAGFATGDLQLLVSDVEDKDCTSGTQVSLSVDCSNVEEMEKIFTTLSEGANVTMPLQDTFWGARFGMLVDKFGVSWMFNYDYPKEEK